MWTATVTQKGRDSTNFNIVAVIEFSNGEATITERIGAVDLTDDQIAEHCRKRIRNVLEVGDAALSALSTGKVTLPSDPVTDDGKEQAQARLSQKLGVLELKKRVEAVKDGDPTIEADLTAYLSYNG